jgi:hypothetical protein
MPSTGCVRWGKYRGSTISPDGGPECCLLAAAHQKGSGAVPHRWKSGRLRRSRSLPCHRTNSVPVRSSMQERVSGQLRQPLTRLPGACHQAIRKTDTASSRSTTATSESSRRAILQMTSFERARRQVPYLRYATPGFTTGHFASGMVAADPDSRTTESRTGSATLLGMPPRIGSTIVHHRGL